MSIITPSGKIITPDSLFVRHRFARNKLEIDNEPMQMEGLFKFIVRRADGSIKQETPFGRNLILNQGLDRWGSGGAAVGFCAVGTGTSAPTAAQTTLVAQKATTTTYQGSVQSQSSSAPWFSSMTLTYRFALGALDGSFTEVGVGPSSPALFSRALITPDGVNPAAITVLPNEQLDVTYQFNVFLPSQDVTGNITLAGNNYSITGRPASAGYLWTRQTAELIVSSSGFEFGLERFSSNQNNRLFAGNMSATVDGSPSGASAQSSGTHINNAYSAGSYQRSGSINWGLNDGNIGGGVRSAYVFIQRGGIYQYQFAPNIPKDATKTLRLDFNIGWARRP
jgi:hypothetical protein